MSVSELPVIDHPRQMASDLTELSKALAASISSHDVRSDQLNRALYATDASVYQIVPLMVAFPATATDVVAAMQVCARFRVPITARGGGTSQAGQSIGPGVILDCSKHLDRVLEINTDERWVRVEPGCVLDELNQALRPYRLLFAPDVSTSNRATIGGMIANNSSGARSVLYGKTIDHVLELKTVLSDGSLVHLKPLTATELEARCSREDREGACYRATRRLAAEHAEEIERRFPKILRRVGGYNLDEFVPDRGQGRGEFNLSRLFVGSEGTLGVTVEAKLKLVELPRAKAVLVVQFADLLEALAATPLILHHGPAAVEVVDQYVLDSTRLNPEANRLRDFLQGDPAAILLVEFYGDRADELPPRLAALERELRQQGFGYHYIVVTDLAAQARVWKLRKMALGLSMAQKGDAKAISFVEDTAVAPEHLRDYIAEFLAAHCSSWDQGRRLRARLGWLPARTTGGRPQDRGGRAEVRGDCRGCLRAGAQVRWCIVGRAWRRPGSQSIPGEDVWNRAVPGIPGAQSSDRPAQLAESGEDRRCAAADGEPALWTELRDAQCGNHL